jgi:hypothetical protein
MAHKICLVAPYKELAVEANTVDIRIITSGRESIQAAVTEASHIVQVLEEEQKAALRLQAILDFVHDGLREKIGQDRSL